MNDELIFQNPQPTRSDALKNRALILETAKRLFAEQGIDAITMTDLQLAAGIGKGTLYRHFKTKIEISEALLDEAQRQLQTRTFEHMRLGHAPGENLRWFVREVLDFVDRNAALLCAGQSVVESLQHPAHWWWRQTIQGLLTQINPPADVDYLTDMLYTMLEVHTVYYMRQVRGYSLERVGDGMTGVLDQILP